jgi:hypothetical protein
VIVLLDTTVFGADPVGAGDAWQVLALAAPTWGIRVAVTEVVVAEAVANYQRDIVDVRAALEGWAKKKRVGALGLSDAFNAAERVLSAGVADYANRLQETLKASGVEVLPIADIPHMELVTRATTRRRPCDDKGDGYRDSLNWLTLLALARAEPEEQIIWVSDNTRDFGSESEGDDSVLHPDLIDDLDSISARERVSWKLKLADAVLALAEKYAPGSESDIKQVQEKVRNASVLEFLARELLPSAAQQSVSPRQCALPLETRFARLRSLEGIRNLELIVKGVVPDERAVAEFTVEVDAGIDADLVYPADVPGFGTITSTRFINKPLLLRGLITLGKFEKPVGAELAAIESLPDDPGRSQWQTHHQELQAASERMRLATEALARSIYENQESMRQAAEAGRSVYESPAVRDTVRWLNEHQETIRQAARAAEAGQSVYEEAVRDTVRWLNEHQETIRQAAQAAEAARGFTSPGSKAEPNSGRENQRPESQSDDAPPPEPSDSG